MTKETPTPAPKKERVSTMAIMLDALQRTHEQAIETVAEQSSTNSRRMWLVILLVICILAAVIGVTASIDLPGVGTIGATPEEAATPAPRNKGRKGAK